MTLCRYSSVGVRPGRIAIGGQLWRRALDLRRIKGRFHQVHTRRRRQGDAHRRAVVRDDEYARLGRRAVLELLCQGRAVN